MTKANECTCPSGDGSLAHPCPAHPAVEQAGGDERAAQWHECTCPKIGEKWNPAKHGKDCPVHQARASLAQPSPAPELERPEVAEVAFVLRNIGAMDAEDIDGDNVDLRFEDAEGRDTGCDVSIVEYAEKAADLFEQHDRIVGALRAENAKLSEALDRWPLIRDSLKLRLADALARVAELERGKVYVEARRCDECQHGGINDSATGVAACHECDWAGPEPEEDKCPGCQRENCMAAACPQCGARYVLVASEEIAAPVAQAQQLHDLDKQCRDDVARALGLRPNEERGFAWSYLLASIKSCVKAAQAQHSVPEGWMLVECGIWTQEQVDEMQRTVARFRSSEFVDDRALAMAVADAGQCKAPEISLAELLAAAPGKEGV
ncbi:hypothetical protein [Pseudomonas aeruginosa]|uniref:hypothetical protein n=1 Tax=Pseudomonas aeruginosa TaxID=287 RepID=UPI003D6E5E3A